MHELLIDLSLDELGRIYEALPEPVVRALDPAIGKALNSRPATVVRRPLAMRLKALRAFLVRNRDEALAGDILRSYFLGPRKDLVTAFLDGVGVAHEDGQVEDEAEPDESKVADAVQALLQTEARSDVLLYLRVARFQWPDSAAVSAAVASLVEHDPAAPED